MKSYKIILAPEAKDIIEEAFLYIKADAPQNALRWLLGLYDEIASLKVMPARCSIIPEQKEFETEVRHLLYHSHRIIFEIDDEKATVRIFAFRHAARARLS